MANKTRYGFESEDETGVPPPAAAPARHGQTVFGHGAHLPSLQVPEAPARGPLPAPGRRAPLPAASTAGAPAALPGRPLPGNAPQRPARSPSGIPARKGQPTPEPRRARRPSMRPRTGPLPAVARFFGRRNTVGEIVPLTETEIPLPPVQSRWVRPAITVLVAAAFSFIVVALAMWIMAPRGPATAPTTFFSDPAASLHAAAPPQPVLLARPPHTFRP